MPLKSKGQNVLLMIDCLKSSGINSNGTVISRHIWNIYKEGELKYEATVSKNETVQKEGGGVEN